MTLCRVCREGEFGDFLAVDGMAYHRCPRCEATLLAPDHLPAADAERSHYLNHENDPDDPGYRAFAARLVDPLAERLGEGSRGLDYGCGPGPAAAAMLRERGFEVALYDPFFEPDESVLGTSYDFVLCSEAVEHFHRPADEFDRLDGLLRPGGRLGVMTCFQTEDRLFVDWHYRRDPTHVAFYRESTLRYLARQRGWSFESPAKDVALFQKQGCRPQRAARRSGGGGQGRT